MFSVFSLICRLDYLNLAFFHINPFCLQVLSALRSIPGMLSIDIDITEEVEPDADITNEGTYEANITAPSAPTPMRR